MRIDAHVHYTPPSLAADLESFAQREPLWGLMLTGGAKSIQGWAEAETMIAEMDAADLDHVILLGEYRLQHDSCVARNNQAIEIIRRWPARVSAFAVLQPADPERAIDELDRCLDAGMRGVGELNPYGCGVRLDDRRFLQVVEACILRQVPLNLHINEAVGHYYPGKSTTPLVHYDQLIGRYPELTLILSHWGGGMLFYELMPEVRKRLRNVYYDCAASPLLYPSEKIFSIALSCVEQHKILYGSDYPLNLYPGKHRQPGFKPFLDEIESLGLPEETLDKILGGNAARLLGLTSAAPAARKEPLAPRARQRADTGAAEITAQMSVQWVAHAWPQTQAVFERYGIAWQDQPVPYWEPIAQAAAAQGYSADQRQRLLEDLRQSLT